MAALHRSGWELNQLGSNSAEFWSSNGATISSAYARTGTYSLRSYATGGGSYSILGGGWSGQSGGLVSLSVWIKVDALPSSNRKLLFLGKVGGSGVKWDMSAYLNTNGKISLNVAGSTRGTTTAAVTLGLWLLLQVEMKIDGANSVHQVKALGETLDYDGNEPDTQAVSYLYLGKELANATYDVYFDDFCLNDDSGAEETGYPDENERVDVLLPIGENVIGGWTGGGGGSESLYDAVDNIPPAGNATETDLTNVKNAVADANDNIDFLCAPYNSKGIGPGYNIHLVQAIVRHGEHAATNTKAGAVQVVTNPAQTGEDSFDFGDDAGAHGTEIGNWRTKYSTPQYNPSVSYGTNPVVRVGKRTASTDVVCCDFVALVVSYAPVPLQDEEFQASGGGVGGGVMPSNVERVFRASGGGVGGGSARMYARNYRVNAARWFSNRMDGTLTVGTAETVLKYPNLTEGRTFEEMLSVLGASTNVGQPTRIVINFAPLHDPVMPAVVRDAILRFLGSSDPDGGQFNVLAYLAWLGSAAKTYTLSVSAKKATIRFPKWGRLKRFVLELRIPQSSELTVEDFTVKEIIVRHTKRQRIGRKFA